MAFAAGQRLTAALLNALAVPDTWHTATLLNSWTGSGSGVNGLFYRKNAAGDVDVIADIVKASGTGNIICAQLPAGYVPLVGQNQQGAWNNPAVSNSASAPWVEIDTSGNIQVTALQVANKEVFFRITIALGAI